MENVIVIGAGPCGLSAAVALQREGLSPLLIEKNCIVNAIYQYPTYLQFFSTPELLEIGGYSFTTPHEKPYRQEALVYYREVARREGLRIHSYEEATLIERYGTDFKVHTKNQFGQLATYDAHKVIVATGYFDHPNMLGIPGEDLPKTTHYYKEAHPYAGAKVAIIGGNNSAVDAAMDLLRVGAEVTVIYRGKDFSANIKPWVRPIFESMVNKGRIHMWFDAQVQRIDELSIHVRKGTEHVTLANDFVLALTGFRPDRQLLTDIGVHFHAETNAPVVQPDTMETNISGLYVAGVVASSKYDANEIFIESGRLHGISITKHIIASLNHPST
ncbi:YpdA family putative bacillithiol disulfide reductase [Paenibacillus roseipurpureus]|uniref:YpdA family putative bacillithiol disulfide reductase n=1 Tax=Paenibacillus roseopurpureus TaxID=2918901 RepID=A0AA96RGG6_9BACL|nr:YpdA family putative bacillithiol disulfide reductase [Paenibacillus sp. MBLB1832]WNR42153.1 YpdA family putative bacillithiol disulfide reductase [Paenibacillus sp. MBLB1832]